MAYDFTATEWFDGPGVNIDIVDADLPFTKLAWVQPDANGDPMFSLTDGSNLGSRCNMKFASGAFRGVSDSGTARTYDTTNTITVPATVWASLVQLEITSTDHQGVMDGDFANRGTSTGGAVYVTGDLIEVQIGAQGAGGSKYNGRVAECTLIQLQFTQAMITAHKNGVPGWRLGKHLTIVYYPLYGYQLTAGIEAAWGGSEAKSGNLTITGGTPARVPHAPVAPIRTRRAAA